MILFFLINNDRGDHLLDGAFCGFNYWLSRFNDRLGFNHRFFDDGFGHNDWFFDNWLRFRGDSRLLDDGLLFDDNRCLVFETIPKVGTVANNGRRIYGLYFNRVSLETNRVGDRVSRQDSAIVSLQTQNGRSDVQSAFVHLSDELGCELGKLCSGITSV